MKCPACEKEGAYKRLRTGETVCRWCGVISPPKKEKKKTPKTP